MLYVDVKYANIVGAQLRNYKRKQEYLWNFSCPVCGDSKTNRSKARGYIYRAKTSLFVKCHKCGYGTNIGNFIKYVDTNLYEEYALETYKEGGAPRAAHARSDQAIPQMFQQMEAIEISDSILDSLKRIDQLPETHPAVKYIAKREIPRDKWNLLYLCNKFKKYVNSVVPNKFRDLDDDHPRLIIPYFTPHGKCFAFQGRAFGKEDPKYITIKVDDTEEKLFGQERLDYSKRVYVLEGPLDSLFIPNAIAVSGSSFNSPTIKALQSNITVVYDNEPRSPTLTKLIKTTIDQGFSVCLWPDTITEKDINEMILAGRSPEEILEIIDANTYNGVEAQLRFATWRKCNEISQTTRRHRSNAMV